MKKTNEKLALATLVIFIMGFVCSLNAQQWDQPRNIQQNKERIEAQKVAFITDRLDLSVDEAERFWPVYNNYKNQLEANRKAWREANKITPEDIDEMTDTEAMDISQAQLVHEQEMLDLRKELINNMKGVIPPQKVLKLLEAEKEFRVELMRKVSYGKGYGEGRYEKK